MEFSRRVFGWAVYDWAGSAYLTGVATALLPAYFAAVVAPHGATLAGTVLPAASLWGYAVGTAALAVVTLGPLLAALGDRGPGRKACLGACCLIGGVAVCLAALAGPGDTWWALGWFVTAHVSYSAGNAFYDAYLPDLASPAARERVSGLGYAAGYLGGGVHLALSLGLVSLHNALGLSMPQAVQLALVLGGLWWLGFGLPSVSGLPEGRGPSRSASLFAAVGQAFSDTLAAARLALANAPLKAFYLAFFFYNDAIGTVISMATLYGKDELHLSESTLLLTLLFIQGVALCGAALFTRLAGSIGGKAALMASLVCWTGLAILARFINTPEHFFALGLGVGLALGGSQSLSRALLSRLVPTERSTVYFGFYSVLVKLSAILGPVVFALVRQFTGSSRPAMLSLVAFFCVGLALLTRVPEASRAAA
ncbi:MFS transporter [Fundidesulfovibrio butyratiphilus]